MRILRSTAFSSEGQREKNRQLAGEEERLDRIRNPHNYGPANEK
jgi:hypothetical protein